MESLRMIWKALQTWWEAWLGLWMFGLVWVLCWVTVILGPPATFGFFYAVRWLITEKEIRWDLFLRPAKEHFIASWLWFLANLLMLFVAFSNYTFYGGWEGSPGLVLRVFSIGVGFLWVAVQFYTLPFFVLMEKKSLLLAWKNALFTILASPLFSLVLWLVLTPLIALHLFIAPIFLAGPGLIVLLVSLAVEDRIQKFRIREKDAEQTN